MTYKRKKSFKTFWQFFTAQIARWLTVVLVLVCFVASLISDVQIFEWFFGVILGIVLFLNYENYVRWL